MWNHVTNGKLGENYTRLCETSRLKKTSYHRSDMVGCDVVWCDLPFNSKTAGFMRACSCASQGRLQMATSLGGLHSFPIFFPCILAAWRGSAWLNDPFLSRRFMRHHVPSCAIMCHHVPDSCWAGWWLHSRKWHWWRVHLWCQVCRWELHSEAHRPRHSVHGQRRPKHQRLPVLPVHREDSVVGWQARGLWISHRWHGRSEEGWGCGISVWQDLQASHDRGLRSVVVRDKGLQILVTSGNIR